MDYRRDTSRDRERAKRLRRLPIVLPELWAETDDSVRVLSFVERWKLYWLGHWYSRAFRGRVPLPAYARKHGVSYQAVGALLERGLLDVVVDTSGRRWLLADEPYPATKIRGIPRGRQPDPSVRALSHTDFRIVNHELGQALLRTPSEDELEAYARVRVAPRLTLAEQNASSLAMPVIS